MVSAIRNKTSVVELKSEEEVRAPAPEGSTTVAAIASKTLKEEKTVSEPKKLSSRVTQEKKKGVPISLGDAKSVVQKEVDALMEAFQKKLSWLEMQITKVWMSCYVKKLHKCEEKKSLIEHLNEGHKKLEKLKKGRSKEDSAVAERSMGVITSIIERLKA